MTSASGGPPSALEEYDKLVRNPSFLPSEAAAASGLKVAFVLAARHVAEAPKAEVRCGQGGLTGSGPRKPRKFKALQRGRHRHAQYLYADQPSCGGRSAARSALAEAS